MIFIEKYEPVTLPMRTKHTHAFIMIYVDIFSKKYFPDRESNPGHLGESQGS